MSKTVGQTYGDIGRKLDDYQKVEELVKELIDNLGIGYDMEYVKNSRLSDRLKAILAIVLTDEDISRLAVGALELEGE